MGELETFFETLAIDFSDLELYARITFQVFLLFTSAIFSGSETALFSLSRIDLQKLRQSRHRDSDSIHAMLDEPRRLIISILCGNELVNIASAVNMTGILLLLFGEQDVGWINILIMVPLLLLVGTAGLTGRPARAAPFPLTVVCEGLQDPGNLGAIVRTADAAGAAGVAGDRRPGDRAGGVLSRRYLQPRAVRLAGPGGALYTGRSLAYAGSVCPRAGAFRPLLPASQRRPVRLFQKPGHRRDHAVAVRSRRGV